MTRAYTPSEDTYVSRSWTTNDLWQPPGVVKPAVKHKRITYTPPRSVEVLFLRGTAIVDRDTVLWRDVKDLPDTDVIAYLVPRNAGLEMLSVKRISDRGGKPVLIVVKVA